MVASLARPGGNATGTVTLSQELEAKRLELLKEAVPGLSRAAALWNSSMPLHPRVLLDVEEAARRLKVRVIPVEWKTAKALGLTIPPSLLLRADQVIE